MKTKKKLPPWAMRVLRRNKVADPSFPDANSGPANDREEREMRLAVAAANQQKRFTDPLTQQIMSESHPLAKQYIEDELFENVGYNEDWLGRRQDATKDSWSAATVTDLGRAFDKDFKGGALHSDYINRAFAGEGNYAPDRINRRTDFQPGDILIQGRENENNPEWSTQGYNFRQFKKRAKDGGNYSSHTDMIVGSGVDSSGRKYYDVQGGNKGDSLYQKRLYAEDLAKNYAGRLTQ